MAGPATGTPTLGVKQRLTQADWLRAQRAIGETVPRATLDALVDRTVDQMRRTVAGKHAAFAWSGGKDSLVLEHLCYQAGVSECVLAMTNLEYPAFLAWVTDHMPLDLEVINTGQDLDWLAAHPRMLFPQDAKTPADWFRQVQHAAQDRYYREHQLDVILLGRRRADGNYTGAAGQSSYTNAQGVTRYSPLRDWSHEHVLAYIGHHAVPLPPIYGWPNGFRCGTHSWPARQYTGSEANGWREVYGIDPTRVREAAAHRNGSSFPGAVACLLERDGRGE